jgi:hypothetical protein
MTKRHERTPLAEYLNALWDDIKGSLGPMSGRDMEAAEAMRREIVVVLEVIRDECLKAQQQSRLRRRVMLYGAEARGRVLRAIGMPDGHRAWMRLGKVDERVVEAALRRRKAGNEVKVRRSRAVGEALARVEAEGQAGFEQVMPDE